jgi:hypothetical protein
MVVASPQGVGIFNIKDLEADGKCPYARLPKSRGMRCTEKYAAVTRDEGNAADGRFPTASYIGFQVTLRTS